MGKKRWIDKKNANTFTLVHRAPEDELYYDNDTPTGVLVEVDDLNSRENKEARKNKYRNPNAGEAAKFGIYFDDTEYDYTQHLATIGDDPEAVFLPAVGTGKANDNIDYQKHMNVPDSIAGFQPDMDPRIREVLVALDDDAYAEDNEQEDGFFSELVDGGEIKDQEKWERNKPREELTQKEDEEDWHFAFRKFKLEQQAAGDSDASDAADVGSDFASDFDSDLGESDRENRDKLGALPTIKSGRKKKRVGAKTDLSGYSMSSSANFRNAGLQLLDDRFEKVEEEYEESSGEEDAEFSMQNERPDFESILDDFLAQSKPTKRK